MAVISKLLNVTVTLYSKPPVNQCKGGRPLRTLMFWLTHYDTLKTAYF